MKHKLLKSVVISAVFLGTTAISAPATNYQVNAVRTYRAYTGSKSITYRDQNGKMTITSVEALRMKNSDYSSAGSQIIAYGTFTNTSHKGISPEDFANDHFAFYQVKSNKWHELTLNSPIIMPPTKHIDYLSSNGEDKTRPHKTVKFAISDNNPIGLSDHQKVTIRVYKEVGVTRKLASKTLTSPETQNAMDYTDVPYNKNPYTSASQRKAIREANDPNRKPKKQKNDTYDGDEYLNKEALLVKPFRQDFEVWTKKKYSPTYVTVLEFYLTNNSQKQLNVSDFLNKHVSITADSSLNLTNRVDFPINSRVDEGLRKAQGSLAPNESTMVALAHVSDSEYKSTIETTIKNNSGKNIGISRSKFKIAYPTNN